MEKLKRKETVSGTQPTLAAVIQRTSEYPSKISLKTNLAAIIT